MSADGRVLRAVRGAITVEHDSAEAIHDGTSELLREVLGCNALTADDLVSIIFTATPDLTSEFPAVAAREMGLSGVPLLCAREIPVDGAMALVGSNFGQRPTPGWVHNLVAHPIATIAHGAHEARVRAEVASAEMTTRVLEAGSKLYGGYANYPGRAAHREIKIFVLQPVEA